MKKDLFHPSRWISSINFQWNTIKYTDFNGYFSFKYSNNWTIENPTENFESLVFADENKKLRWPHLWVLRRYEKVDIDLNSLLLSFSEDLKANWFDLENLEEIKTDSLEWIQMVLANTVEDKKYKMIIVISLMDQKKIYLLSYVAAEEDFQENKEWFDQIVQSFEILK